MRAVTAAVNPVRPDGARSRDRVGHAVTMKDVARTAGVSQAAVSYAYNRPDQLSPQVRARILLAAAELNYPGPHPAGQVLRSGHAGAVGLMITDSLPYAFTDPATVELLRGVAEVGEMAEVMLTLLPLRSASRNEDSWHIEADEAALSNRSLVDGFLIYSLPDEHIAVDAAVRRNLPTVIIDAPRRADVSYVGVRDKLSARWAAQHLLELGHRRIGVLVDRLLPDGGYGLVDASRLRAARDGVARERLAGYRQALRAAGVDGERISLVEAGGFDEGVSDRAVLTLLEACPNMTAVLASTDVLALAALRVLASRGIQVPEQVSVVGFDDIPAAAAAGLTTVAQPLIDKGRQAASLLMGRGSAAPPRRVVLPTELVVRTSTGAAVAL